MSMVDGAETLGQDLHWTCTWQHGVSRMQKNLKYLTAANSWVLAAHVINQPTCMLQPCLLHDTAMQNYMHILVTIKT